MSFVHISGTALESQPTNQRCQRFLSTELTMKVAIVGCCTEDLTEGASLAANISNCIVGSSAACSSSVSVMGFVASGGVLQLATKKE